MRRRKTGHGHTGRRPSADSGRDRRASPGTPRRSHCRKLGHRPEGPGHGYAGTWVSDFSPSEPRRHKSPCSEAPGWEASSRLPGHRPPSRLRLSCPALCSKDEHGPSSALQNAPNRHCHAEQTSTDGSGTTAGIRGPLPGACCGGRAHGGPWLAVTSPGPAPPPGAYPLAATHSFLGFALTKLLLVSEQNHL